MKLTLKKAHRLVKDMENEINSQPSISKTLVTHSITDIEQVQAAHREMEEEILAFYEQKEILINVNAKIRAAIGTANIEVKFNNKKSINELLADKARLSSQAFSLHMHTSAPKKSKTSKPEEIFALVQSQRARGENANPIHVMNTHSSTGYEFESAMYKKYKAYKDELSEVQDLIVAANNIIEIEIEFSEEELAVLTEIGLV